MAGPERVGSVFMSTSCSLYDWCFPLHDEQGANSLAGEKKKGGGALKCDALSGSGSSVPRSHLGAFDDAWRVRVGEVSGAKNTSRG